jgi:hypothetical protein
MSISDIIAASGLLVSLVGIPVTFVLARRTRQRPELRFATDFDVILSPSSNLFDQGLYMTLGDRQIESISRTRIAIWNQRGDTIHDIDILNDDPLRLQLKKGDTALQVRILSISRKQTALTVGIDKEDQSSVPVNFKFLDTGDGAVFEVIHKGPSKPTLRGTLQGSDIRNAGSAKLGPDAIAAVAQRSRLRRFRQSAPKRARGIVSAYVLAISVYVALFLYVILSSPHSSSDLVNVRHYNLKTHDGQVGFAQAVNSLAGPFGGQSYFLIWILLGFIILASCTGAFTFYWFSRRKIPQSITSNRSSIASDGSEEV